MPRPWFKRQFAAALAEAKVSVNGDQPWDIRVRDERLYRRVALSGPLGLGDACVDGWWVCDTIDQLFDRCLRADLPARLRWSPGVIGVAIRERLLNRQSKPRIGRKIRAHYDLGNDLFAAMLDRRMVYSCGYWEHAANLDDAQEAKLDLICRKLGLRPGLSLLDIGCGWGGLCRFAAERYGCRTVGITLSPEQAALARDRCRGLPVEIRLQDYRDVRGSFDRIVSVGMFEHVGPRNYRAYMRATDRCLAPDGLCLLHFFATRRSWPDRRDSEAFWVERRIFPGMAVPSMAQFAAAAGGFVFEDLHNIGAHYDPTLMAWHANFKSAWPDLRVRYGDRFERLWSYYLLSCAGAFRSRKYHVWQIVLSRLGVLGGYRPVRESQSAEPPEVVTVPRPSPASAAIRARSDALMP